MNVIHAWNLEYEISLSFLLVLILHKLTFVTHNHDINICPPCHLTSLNISPFPIHRNSITNLMTILKYVACYWCCQLASTYCEVLMIWNIFINFGPPMMHSKNLIWLNQNPWNSKKIHIYCARRNFCNILLNLQGNHKPHCLRKKEI